MTITDPIADMLTRIRNGQMAGHSAVAMPSSKVKIAIAGILKEEGFLEGFEEVEGEKPHEKIGYLPCGICLLVRTVPLLCDSDGLRAFSDCEPQDQQKRHCDQEYSYPVPPNELCRLVERARRSRLDGLMFQVP